MNKQIQICIGRLKKKVREGLRELNELIANQTNKHAKITAKRNRKERKGIKEKGKERIYRKKEKRRKERNEHRIGIFSVI